MVPKQIVRSSEVVEGRFPYSQCTRVGNLLFISGQVAWDKQGNLVGAGDVVVQAGRCFEQIRSLVEAAGGTLDDIAKVTMFLRRMSDTAALRAVREKVFRPPYPAWTTVEVSGLVQPELLLEVEAIAALAG